MFKFVIYPRITDLGLISVCAPCPSTKAHSHCCGTMNRELVIGCRVCGLGTCSLGVSMGLLAGFTNGPSPGACGKPPRGVHGMFSRNQCPFGLSILSPDCSSPNHSVVPPPVMQSMTQQFGWGTREMDFCDRIPHSWGSQAPTQHALTFPHRRNNRLRMALFALSYVALGQG